MRCFVDRTLPRSMGEARRRARSACTCSCLNSRATRLSLLLLLLRRRLRLRWRRWLVLLLLLNKCSGRILHANAHCRHVQEQFSVWLCGSCTDVLVWRGQQLY